jgi:hypothetical protein
MQTVARNIALGNGLSTAAGTIPTNGVQPLATVLFAALFAVAGGSKTGGVALVTVFSTLVVAAAAFLLFRVARRYYAPIFGDAPTPAAAALAVGAAAMWFIAPQITSHSMNGLETGVYYLAILGALSFYLSFSQTPAKPSWPQRILLGVLLGFVFLARNDGVFFIAALLLSHLLLGDRTRPALTRRLTDCVAAGVTSIIVASPWLIFNFNLFGTIMPISGIAESHRAHFGYNIDALPANLFEATTLFAPIPRALESNPAVAVCAVLIPIAIAVAGWFAVGRRSLASRRIYMTTIIFTVAIALYYSLFFGAKHFVPRYYSAFSPLMWMLTVAVGAQIVAGVARNPRTTQFAITAVIAAFVLFAANIAFKRYANGPYHQHRQVVEWIDQNAGEDVWVGAIQTGTLGFFHDRTINLDGKVNPYALEEKLAKGHVLDYVEASDITYLADWAAIADWVDSPNATTFSKTFTVVVKDQKKNLGVLKRVETGDK